MNKHKPIFISQPAGGPGTFLASLIVAMLRHDEEIFEVNADGNCTNYYIRYKEQVMQEYSAGKPWDYSTINFNGDDPIIITTLDSPSFENLDKVTDDYLHIRIAPGNEDMLWIYTNLFFRRLINVGSETQRMSLTWDAYKLLQFKKQIDEQVERLEDLSPQATEKLMRYQEQTAIAKPWKKLCYVPETNHPHPERCWDIAHTYIMFQPLELMAELESRFNVSQEPVHYYNYLRYLEYQQFFIRRQAPWLEHLLPNLQKACAAIETKYDL